MNTGIVTRSYEELPAGAVAAMLQESSSFAGPIDEAFAGRPRWQAQRVYLSGPAGWIRLVVALNPRSSIELVNPT